MRWPVPAPAYFRRDALATGASLRMLQRVKSLALALACVALQAAVAAEPPVRPAANKWVAP